MAELLNLVKETIEHFNEGARAVRAYTNNTTYIITKANETGDFWIATEEPGFKKVKTNSLDQYFADVFGIEAKY